jgi:hypothetical protein
MQVGKREQRLRLCVSACSACTFVLVKRTSKASKSSPKKQALIRAQRRVFLFAASTSSQQQERKEKKKKRTSFARSAKFSSLRRTLMLRLLSAPLTHSVYTCTPRLRQYVYVCTSKASKLRGSKVVGRSCFDVCLRAAYT